LAMGVMLSCSKVESNPTSKVEITSKIR